MSGDEGEAPLSPRAPSGKLSCDWDGCGAVLSLSSLLYEHLLSVHLSDTIKPVWGACTKDYRIKQGLQAHLRSHLPDASKPHAWHLCDYRTTTSQGLQAHLRHKIHDTPSPAPAKQLKRKADALLAKLRAGARRQAEQDVPGIIEEEYATELMSQLQKLRNV
ncbi:hypothetical protein EXIGLDRAFT_761953 [Exidia glandulosa HHB12029]|uniref:C2H2-type domain-containing protein n=1 Tax=Exidia glandulosa HHB12029 TaxID=1314781 RepID=A0A166BDA8_EXIGL|nr:hypothetical protein EXIGLDRAFT_761953 [Exidia glandulosa HHB12029]